MSDVSVSVTGLTATGNAGQLLVYSAIVPSQEPNYTEITPQLVQKVDKRAA